MADPITQRIREFDADVASLCHEAEEDISLSTIQYILSVHSQRVETRHERVRND